MTEAREGGETVAVRPSPGTVLAGYRLIRELAGDAGRSTWLARAGQKEPCIMTVCGEDDALRRRAAAHQRVRSPHVLALVDIATDGCGRILLVSERTDWSVATLLGSRAHLAAGEAVTVLAPLAGGLAALHVAGLVHGRLGASTVLFSTDGRPIIAALESVRDDDVCTPDADGSMRWTPGAVADFRAVSGLIRTVAGAVDEPADAGLSDVADWLDSTVADGPADGSLLVQLECRIFAVAPALPLVLVADRQAADPSAAAGVRAGSSWLPGLAPLWDAVAGSPAGSRIVGRLAEMGVGAWLRRVAQGRALAVCAGILVLILAVSAGLTVVPPERSVNTPLDRPAGDRSASSTPDSPAPEKDDAGLSLTPAEKAAVTGDDTAAATVALLDLRARCAVARAMACVTEFAEPASALDDADRYRFAGAGREVTFLVDPSTRARIDVVQGYGDAVLTRVTPSDEKRQPVLVLVVRTDTGWRLRDAFEPD